MPNYYIDHVAILVNDLGVAEKALPESLNRGEVNEFISEGTREQYLDCAKKSCSILLMQPIGEGPYQRALQKRGEGLHHICIRVKNIEDFLEQICQTGFLLHPCSVKTLEYRTIYLCRPGIDFIVEVEELKPEKIYDGKSQLISRIGLPLPDKEFKICTNLLGDFICQAKEPTLKLILSAEENLVISSLKSL